MITDDIDGAAAARPEPTPTTRERARRTVAAQAIDAADCRQLLDMLALFPETDADHDETTPGAAVALLSSIMR
ncbi:hypothetical protein [Embleya hyalina]|uniref:Uncharacterized protein n=1 Tax=Embleya hyalina TaxID=516124 RepID=A0A401YQL3_9ACTN|nr:hypothetical protein [Embleya hyalina]GCD96908.1 hypothetical protein EHYA_04595 [Embleya hyalina]